MNGVVMSNIIKVSSCLIFFLFPISGLTKISGDTMDFQVGDTFACTTDALVSIGDEGWKSRTANGEVLEYNNVSFGLTLESEDKIDFTDSYPMGAYIGASNTYEIKSATTAGLYYGDKNWFGKLTRILHAEPKFKLTAFNILYQTLVINATCEKF
tara:strand:- start:356 stop:820 length:465 start_codon:yes stop_codon:yes gene_type:complete